jgi:hypothetical protein
MGVSRHGKHDDSFSTVGAITVDEQMPATAAPLSQLSPTRGTWASAPSGGSQQARPSHALGRAMC